MLVEAERQGNLPGEIAIDEMPEPGRVYHRIAEDFATDAEFQKQASPASIGSNGLMPNLFDEQPNKSVIAPARATGTTRELKSARRRKLGLHRISHPLEVGGEADDQRLKARPFTPLFVDLNISLHVKVARTLWL